MAVGCQLVLHCLALTRPVVLRGVIEGALVEGACAVVRLELVNGPEFVLQGAHVVFWDSPRNPGARHQQEGARAAGDEGVDEGRAIGVGVAVALLDESDGEEAGAE